MSTPGPDDLADLKDSMGTRLPPIRWHAPADVVAPSFISVHLHRYGYNVETTAEWVLTYLSKTYYLSMADQLALVDQIRRQNSERLQASDESLNRLRMWRERGGAK